MRRESTRLVPNDLGRVFGYYALGLLFGEDVSKDATHRYLKALAAARSSNEVRSLGPAIITTGGAGNPIPRPVPEPASFAEHEGWVRY